MKDEEKKEEVTPAEKTSEDETPVEVKPVDRSAYNCATCKGSGLIDQETICSTCGGTGKV